MSDPTVGAAPAQPQHRLESVIAACPASWDSSEPLLQPEEGRRTFYPLWDEKAYRFYKDLQSLHWVPERFNMQEDAAHWRERLGPARRTLYEYVLGFFAIADELVLENIDDHIAGKVQATEACCFYGAQREQEAVHSEAYSIQVQALLAHDRQEVVFHSIEQMGAVERIRRWVRAWFRDDVAFSLRLLAFAFVEGVLFTCHFLAIQLLRNEGLMPGLTGFNEYISRDENKHCEFACFLLRERMRRLPPANVAHWLADQAVGLVDDFFSESLGQAAQAQNEAQGGACGPDNCVPRVTRALMGQHVRSVADWVLDLAGYAPLYQVRTPFPEARVIALQGKTNFFEQEVTEYQEVQKGALEFGVEEEPDYGDM